jgi:hypothetical protein
MLTKARDIEGFKLNSLDGEFGKVKDFYFDDQYWTIRYLVAETGTWLPGREVLISPYAVTGVNWVEKSVGVRLTKEKIKGSPSPDSDRPISRQFEGSYYAYYSWPGYWGGPYNWGASPYISYAGNGAVSGGGADEEKFDHHLRSARVVTGYRVKASDGAIGHIEDFIVDDKTWAIRYLVIDTRNWLSGRRVLVSPRWIETISWADASVSFNVPRETIGRAPEYNSDSSLTRDYEADLHGYYDRRGYWVEEPVDGLVVI